MISHFATQKQPTCIVSLPQPDRLIKPLSGYFKQTTMKTRLLSCSILSLLVAVASLNGFAQDKKSEPWTAKQLMAPADLAKNINSGKNLPTIVCVGPSALIKGSTDIGPASEKANVDKLKATLSKLPKDARVVIYCGCCPFDRCPNIRPAFNMLNQMKFTNAKLLNLSTNIRTDWINKGYPVNE